MTAHQHGHHENPPADTDPARFWDERYSQSDRIWSGRVNPVLAEVAADLSPGTVLDLGSGEGGDAIWLAARGWRVTAVDVSSVALDRLAAEAERAGVAERITTLRHDVTQGFPPGRFDLVSAQFFQSPLVLPREKVLPPAAAAVAPGGRLLVVEHGAPPPWSGLDPDDPRFATPEEILAAVDLDADGWEIERLGAAHRTATHDGHTGELVDHVVLVRRR
ncbi:class I SAM-dependent methyltransferase [Micromonospora sp. WMMA2032]|uniref:Methyltransferase domain-containing protein n=1 Tax=Micromonospora sediminicola TaxID=946078 RepID=A0A1A9BAT8_9ACTN|nr:MULTISPECIES: class I SAM-dependent methyltransferase [Micromonospora]ATO17581.1 class I SAM-dependent methyltransferase [Micromonospora sp. WMMA2032]SBT66176.1 Methyltransferase domain-containing protein [Micromonospora sediminicola]